MAPDWRLGFSCTTTFILPFLFNLVCAFFLHLTFVCVSVQTRRPRSGEHVSSGDVSYTHSRRVVVAAVVVVSAILTLQLSQ